MENLLTVSVADAPYVLMDFGYSGDIANMQMQSGQKTESRY